MPKPRPRFSAGTYFQFFNRGRSRLSICHNKHDYLNIQQRLKYYSRALNLTMIAYCLMPNHYHFLVRQEDEKAAGLLPQRIFNGYAKWYNHRYDHSGTIFEGEYRVDEIAEQHHLLHLCRYFHANPVKDGIISEVSAWGVSNYLEWIEGRNGTLVDRSFVSEHFVTPSDYVAYVAEYLSTFHR
ncbi:MAG: hypothetical protein GY759_00355 [Chloroflexi bacterium]|nr:hypothetical protein [Chloroflexota bacterium]